MTEPDTKLIQLHLGLGSFHRAHQCIYMQDLLDSGDSRWTMISGNIRPDMEQVADTLKSQGCEYTLEMVTPEGEFSYRRIQAIGDVIPWDAQLQGLIRVAENPATRIISFTVTEAGYYLDDNDSLDVRNDDIQSDLDGKSRCTIYGALAAMLRARMTGGVGPVTLLNCDNLRENGKRFKKGLLQFVKIAADFELFNWIETNVTTPNSMVDRITPRPTDDVIARVKAATGQQDKVPVMSEDFIQWVIEDEFIAERPAWENIGVEMVMDVEPYEEAKIRLLNGTHSCIAWAGTLRGYEYIHEGALNAEVRQFAYDYATHNVIPCLIKAKEPSPVDLEKYRDTVLRRFSNANIQDTNQRVSMDAYSKIPSFILPTIVESLEAGREIDSVAILPALFLEFLFQLHQGNIPFEYQDQGMDSARVEQICKAGDPVLEFGNDRLLFGKIAGDQRLLEALRNAFSRVNLFSSQQAAQEQ